MGCLPYFNTTFLCAQLLEESGSDHGLFHLKGVGKIMKTLLKISGLQSTKYIPLSIGTYLFGM
jgi:hypothetical protein